VWELGLWSEWRRIVCDTISHPCLANHVTKVIVDIKGVLHLSTSTMAKWNLKLFIGPYCLGLGLLDYIRVVWSPIENGNGWKLSHRILHG
jgi:hypothetical protein